MRALHLVFGLHHAYSLKETPDAKAGYFGGAESFQEADKREYQPLFALLERNVQKYPKMHVSLVVSGVWIEQAEQWSPELVKRLKKLVGSGNVEMIVTPYYDSLAAFYDMDELAAQVRRDREKMESVLGAKSKVLALPEYLYHNRIARWAEKMDFEGVLAGDATKILDWRTCNKVYDAKGCERLRVLFVNAQLTDVIERADSAVMETEDVEGSEKVVYSAAKYQKMLDLAFLRGSLINLYFESELFDKRRGAGIIGMFDELIRVWMEAPGRCLVGATEVVKLPATAEVSVKRTIARREQAQRDYTLPKSLMKDGAEKLYALREQVVTTKDRDLYVDFAKLTAVDMEYDEKFEQVLADLKRRIQEVGEVGAEGAVENGVAESHRVNVNIKTNPEKRAKQAEFIRKVKDVVGDADEWLNMDDLDDAEAEVQVLAQRISWQSMEQERDTADLAEAEVVGDEDDEVEVKAGMKGGAKAKMRTKESLRERLSKKIVIE